MDPASEFLSWDSNFFGVRVARLLADRLTPDDAEQALNWCRQQRIACLYLLADSGDRQTAGLAAEHGFRMTDLRVNMVHNPAVNSACASSKKIRLSREEDVPALAAIARASHHDSRFYHDSRFNRSRCDDLYATWIENSCRGWAQRVFVATVNEEAAGYCSCHLRSEHVGSIGLCAVAVPWQGNGLGIQLVNSALAYFHSQGASRVTVVTQGRNAAAQRLYERAGFVTESTQNWYHKWFE